jgi:hypothetical protein
MAKVAMKPKLRHPWVLVCKISNVPSVAINIQQGIPITNNENAEMAKEGTP